MTTLLLIRHGATDWLGRGIAGRQPGVHLNQTGREQARQLAEGLAGVKLAALYASPMERTLETAWPLAQRLGRAITIVPELDEIDFGAWTAKSMAELEQAPGWREWNERRSTAQAPGGEAFAEAQRRIVSGLERLAAWHPDETIAVFSHGDPIKAALMHYLEVPLDHILRLEADPASVSTLVLGGWIPRVLRVNAVVG